MVVGLVGVVVVVAHGDVVNPESTGAVELAKDEPIRRGVGQ